MWFRLSLKSVMSNFATPLVSETINPDTIELRRFLYAPEMFIPPENHYLVSVVFFAYFLIFHGGKQSFS
jgi:hypothetical protein